jgi:formylmethanofuran dehydrogenase subunit E
MKNYTIEEKTILSIALDHYIDSLETTRSILHDTGNENCNALAPALTKFRDLRVKLMLDIAPIKIKPNQLLFRSICPLCGANERPDTPKWAFINGNPVCHSCFEKHDPYIVWSGTGI